MNQIDAALAGRIATVHARIGAAARRAGRDPADVTLVAVSKTQPPEIVASAWQAGLRVFGENRVEEAGPKASALAAMPETGESLIWHMVGHLQSRKAGDVLPWAAMVHSVESEKLAQRLSRACVERGRMLAVLLEVNVSGEASKYGLPPADLDIAARTVAALPGLRLEGLMTMAPVVASPEQARPVFAGLRERRDALVRRQPELDLRHLSMGMTDDFEVAIEEGATLVRIGRAIFGERTIDDMPNDTTLSFIGSGVMGEAMIRGILTQNLIGPEAITASDPLGDRVEELHKRYGVRGVTDNHAAARTARIIVLSIKPQSIPKVLPEIRDDVTPDTLVISIVAGTPIAVIQRELGVQAVVRAMPNTPGQIGHGMTVWTATPEVSDRGRLQAQAILGALGHEHYVNDEDYLDMATALSGTGPAYVFLFMEALIDAGVHLGFSRRVAQELVYQTVEGSVKMARETGLHPTELRNSVTSPGGTTAEALYQLEKGGLRTVISRAIWAAYQRSKTLGELANK